MNIRDCNTRQRKAFVNICHAAHWIIGGLENQLQDSTPGSAEYQEAKKALEDHEGLVQTVYQEATTAIYQEDGCFFGGNIPSYLKDIRFCGKEWLMERCEARVKKCGY